MGEKMELNDNGNVYEVENIEFEEISIKGSSSVDEEDYGLDNLKRYSQNADIIRYEMNSIELPIFSKDKKIKEGEAKIYMFDKGKNQYIEVKPTGNSKIPQEFDERVFIAIMRMSRKQGNPLEIYTSYSNLVKEAGLEYNNENLRRTKESIRRLSETIYIFSNIFYQYELRGINNDKITTAMISVREIEFKEEKEVPQEAKKFFNDKRIKEILQIRFMKHFYDNIITKGYLNFDSNQLFAIENSVSRNLYTMMTKWRVRETYLKRHSSFLASRIPLSWKKSNIPSTIRSLKRSFDDLKQKDLIVGYKFSEDLPLDKSYFEVFFDNERSNLLNNKESFLTGQENIQIAEEKIVKEDIISFEEIMMDEKEKEIIKELTEKNTKISFESAVKEVAKHSEKEFDYVLYCLKKSIEKADNVIAYFNSVISSGVLLNEYINQKKLIEKEENTIKAEEEKAAQKLKEKEKIVSIIIADKTSEKYLQLREEALTVLKITTHRGKKSEEIDEEIIERTIKYIIEMKLDEEE